MEMSFNDFIYFSRLSEMTTNLAQIENNDQFYLVMNNSMCFIMHENQIGISYKTLK